MGYLIAISVYLLALVIYGLVIAHKKVKTADDMVTGGHRIPFIILVGSLAGSAAGVPANLVQAVFGVAVSTLLAAALRRSSYVRREFPRL